MKLGRAVERKRISQMCEEYGLYTCGSNEEYNHLLYDLCSIDDELNYRVVSDSDIEKIARDIVDHTDRGVFDALFPSDSKKLVVLRWMYAKVADACFNFVLEF